MPAGEGVENNLGAAEGEAALDGEAAIFQELGHDLGQDLPLDILLAADDDRTHRGASDLARNHESHESHEKHEKHEKKHLQNLCRKLVRTLT